MKLLSVIHGEVYGGAHNQLVRLADPLAARGIETIALLPESANEAAARIRAAGIATVQIPLARLRASLDPRQHARLALQTHRDIKAIEGQIVAAGIDAVQVHGPTNPQAAIAASRTQRAVVWQLLDTRAPMTLRRITMPLVTRMADSMTVWGMAVASEHPGSAALGRRQFVVYPPVDLAAFSSSAERRRHARLALGVSEDSCVVGSIGVLNPQKGHEFLIAAIGELPAHGPPIELRVLGAPSPPHAAYARRLHAEIEARALGRSGQPTIVDPGDRVAELIHGLDILVMPSVPRSEGMPTVILEAMAAGKPVVATDVGAVRELVSDGRSGLIVAPENVAALSGAVQQLAADSSLRSAMGREGARIAAEQFSLEDLAGLHERAIRAAIEHADRRSRRGRTDG